MLDMVNAELLKAWHKKRFWLLVALFAVLIPAAQLAGAAFVTRIAGDAGGAAAEQVASPFNLARNAIGGALPALLMVIAAIVAVFLIGEDRGYRMWKVIFTSGRDRLMVLAAKFLAGMAILAAIVAGALAGSLVFGAVGVALGLADGFGGDWGTLLALYALQWLALAAPLALGFLVSWVVASPAIAVIAIVILPGLVEGVITASITAQARGGMLGALTSAATIRDRLEAATRFYFTNNVNIGSRYATDQVSQAFGTGAGALPFATGFAWDTVWWSLGVAAVYLALFAGLTVWSFTTRDVHD